MELESENAKILYEVQQAIKVLDATEARDHGWEKLIEERELLDQSQVWFIGATREDPASFAKAPRDFPAVFPVFIDDTGRPFLFHDPDRTLDPVPARIWCLPIWKMTSAANKQITKVAASNNATDKYFSGIETDRGGRKMTRTTPRDITDPAIPISWFFKHRYMSPGQALSLFLKSELDISWTQGGRLIGKSECTFRRSYHVASEKKARYSETNPKKRKRFTAPEKTVTAAADDEI
jgi:hypothetical protein